MNRMLAVCFLVVGLVAGVGMLVVREDSARAASQAELPRTRGISVEMAATKNAEAMPEADRGDAWVITVRRDGAVHFGVDQVTPEGLIDKMAKTPRNRAAKLYVKADARGAFSSVQAVLEAARADFFDDVVLLTAQAETAQAGAMVPPHGIDVWIGDEAGSGIVGVQVDSQAGTIEIKVNHDDVAAAGVQDKVAKLFDHRSGKIVRLKAGGDVPYGEVVRALDACRGAGASRIVVSGESGI